MTGRTARSARILVVDDEAGLREVARRILVRAGYQVIVAGGGEEALALLGQERDAVDLLLTDVVMPRMSGKQLAARLLRSHPALKVLYMSGYADGLIGLDEVDALIEKPFDREILLVAVGNALGRRHRG